MLTWITFTFLSWENIRFIPPINLEENSYSFIRRHKILAGGKIPRGYRSVWKDRHKLAVAKLIGKALLTKKENYATIVLESTGNMTKDEFIEVHIYGKINKEAILSVCGKSNVASEKDKVEKIKEQLKKRKKDWIEG
jgi:glyceraldehyde-3-phosphate dehydrogenase/erythrose-4-phosphate dehydrogenase